MALAAALAVFATQEPSQIIHEGSIIADNDDVASQEFSATPSIASSTCSSPCPSLSASSCAPEPAFRHNLGLYPSRRNEHLAVLLPKNLWKPDSLASHCDNFYCRIKFSIFERRHHCRKCGGVFCGKCTGRTTSLLDASNLNFLHPPRHIPLATYESPTSPIVPGRVCDDCWEQLNGCPTPRTPRVPPQVVRSTPLAMKKSFASESSSLASSISTPPNELAVMPKRVIRGVRSSPQLSVHRARPFVMHLPETVREVDTPPECKNEQSFGELDAYPLRKASAVCKATGGGRWCPKQSPFLSVYRIPGCKAPFEIEMEREEEEARLRLINPIIRDGAFQYRFIQQPERRPVIGLNPYHLSAF